MLKKILLITTFIFLGLGVSACSRTQTPAASPAGGEIPVPATTSSASNQANNSGSKTVNPNNSAATVAAPTASSTSEPASVQNKVTMTQMLPPSKQPDLLGQYSRAILKTNFGDITVKFYSSSTPLAVNNFLYLAKSGFYNNTKFHRIIKDFMIQGGDPLTKTNDSARYGTGGPGYQFKNETSGHNLVAGSLAMANAGPNTNGSQFFIVTASSTPWLDGAYTNFGQVTAGMDVVNKIQDIPVVANPSNPNEISFPTQDVIINSIELLK